jgi:predicted tellurium resistance membrane protein TerC
MSELLTAENAVAFLTLASLEVVLGIDNIVFISILTGRLPERERKRARFIGLAIAMLSRIALLFAIRWVMGLTRPLIDLWDHSVTGKDLILFFGGLFLVAKATMEIHDKLEGGVGERAAQKGRTALATILFQILLLDLVFSLDSVITAVGMAKEIAVMVAAVIVAVLVMMAFAGAISDFIERHPTMKILALSFLILIGVMLVAESTGKHIEKGYIYFAMAFALLVEVLNMRMRRVAEPVHLHGPQAHARAQSNPD